MLGYLGGFAGDPGDRSAVCVPGGISYVSLPKPIRVSMTFKGSYKIIVRSWSSRVCWLTLVDCMIDGVITEKRRVYIWGVQIRLSNTSFKLLRFFLPSSSCVAVLQSLYVCQRGTYILHTNIRASLGIGSTGRPHLLMEMVCP